MVASNPTVSITPAGPVSLDIGQIQTFTATATGGSGTYSTYEWYVDGALEQTSPLPTYSFSEATAGTYTVYATVEDTNGAVSPASNTVTVTVWLSATSTATVSDNSATIDESATTGVSVTVSGSSSSLPNGATVTLTSTDYINNQPSGTGPAPVGGAVFFDISVTSSSGPLGSGVDVLVSITNPGFTSASVIEYWNGAEWVQVIPTTFTPPDTVSGTIPASALDGTPIVVGAGAWPMFRSDPSHDGVGTGNAALTGTLLWKYTIGYEVYYSSPAVVNGVVYVGSFDDDVYALNATNGAYIWSYTTGNMVESSPAVVNGVVYVGSLDGYVYALNATNGAKLWSYLTDGSVFSSPAVVNGVVYVGSEGDDVYALNATNGAFIWSYTTGNMVESSPAVVNGVVYVGSLDGYVYALNATNGAKLWSYNTEYDIESTSPAVVNGVVYIGCDNDDVYALNATNGAFIWSYTTGSYIWSSPAVAGGVVYVGSVDDNVYALNATNGAFIWSYKTGAAVDSSPAVVRGVVYVGSVDDNVYALNATNGAFIWSYKTGDGVISSPAVVNGVVYVGSLDGNVYALGSVPLVAPSVSPSPGTVDQGQTSVLSSSAVTTGIPPYTYQWFEKAPGETYATVGTNSTSYSFVTSGSTVTGSYSFILQVTDSTGTAVNSTAATVTVNSALTAPSVHALPSTVDQGQTSFLSNSSLVNTGTGPYSYQWYSEAPGASSYSTFGSASIFFSTDFATSTSTATGTWKFILQVTDSTGAAVNSTATLVTVNSALGAPSVTPTPGTVDQGQTSALSSLVTTGTSPYTYQWFEKAPGGSYVTVGSNSASFNFVTSGSAATGSYSFILHVTDSTGAAVNSTAVTVLVDSALAAPSVTPSPGTVNQGQISSLSSSAVTTGTEPYMYQWFSEAPGASSYSLINGATSSSYNFVTSTSTATGVWSFILQVTDSTGAAVNSTAATVTVSQVVPEFQPFMLLPLFMMTTLLAAIILKRKRNVKK
jgi:outer membrane protein assembly factor BamB